MSKARSLNKVMLIGNLTRSPVVRESSTGIVVCSMGLATNTSWKDKSGGIQERTEYHNIVAFNKLAEICANVLDTGMLVYVEGELRNRVYEDASGQKKYSYEIKVNDMYVLDSKGKKGVGYDAAKSLSGSGKEEEILEAIDNNVSEEVDTKDLF